MSRKRKSEWLRVQKSREIRLWVTTIGVTAVGVVNFLETHPELKRNLRDGWDDFANRFRKNPKIVYYPPKNN